MARCRSDGFPLTSPIVMVESKRCCCMEKLAVSLVMCTKNRAIHLGECLDYVARLQPKCSWEFIVVDNGSSDGTRDVLEKFAAKATFPITVLFEGTPGLNRARNAGWNAARGEIVAYTDDDCNVTPDYIDRVREIYDETRIGFSGGRVDLFDPTDYPISIKISTEPEYLPPQHYVEPGWILGANMMFRRHVLEAIGGFDPELGPGTPFYGDEVDAQARASFAGWWGFYTPNAVISHHHRRKATNSRALMRIYAKSSGSYTAKFLLTSGTRSIYMRVCLRRWYWQLRGILSGRYRMRSQLSYLWWEVQGLVGYL